MPSLRQIRRRIRSVQGTAKITHAMEVVAALKMRQAQARVLAGRPYAEKLQEVISRLSAQPMREEQRPPLLRQRPERRRVQLIHVTPDRGLCGGLNSVLNRLAGEFILNQRMPVRVICVGRKGRDFMVRTGQDVEAIFTDLGDRPRVMDILPIARMAITDFIDEQVDEVYVLYARFFSTMVQRPTVQRLLPVQPATLPAAERVGYIFEPRASDVLRALLPRFVEREIYQTILEGVASEQSARMVAMRNATENARDMIDDLTLLLNKVRQETITKELLDIVGGAAAARR